MYIIKNLTEKSLKKELLEEFLEFANKQLDIDKPYSVYFVEDKHNAADALGRTAMYNPSTNSVYVYVTNRHPKDILRSIAHELVHHKQHCNGDLEKMSLEDAEIDANAGGYLLRQFEDGRRNIDEQAEQLNEIAPLAAAGAAILAGLLFKGDTPEEMLKNNLMLKLKRRYERGELKVSEAEFKKMIKDIRESAADKTTLEQVTDKIDLIGMYPGIGAFADLINIVPKLVLFNRYRKRGDQFVIPFTDYSIDMSTFYLIDAAISALSAVEIGEPWKILKIILKKGITDVKTAILFSETYAKIAAYLSKEGLFNRFLVRFGSDPAKIKRASAALETAAETAKITSKNLQQISKFRKTVDILRRAKPQDMFDLIFDGKLGIFRKLNWSKRFEDLVEKFAKKISKADMKALKAANVRAFDDLIGSAQWASKEVMDLARYADELGVGLTAKQKNKIGNLIRLVDEGKIAVSALEDFVFDPLVKKLKSKAGDLNKNIEIIKQSEKTGAPLSEPLTKIEIDFSDIAKKAGDLSEKAVFDELVKMSPELFLAYKEIIGQQLKQIIDGSFIKMYDVLVDKAKKLATGKLKIKDLPEEFLKTKDYFVKQLNEIRITIYNTFNPKAKASSELLNQLEKATESAYAASAVKTVSRVRRVKARVKTALAKAPKSRVAADVVQVARAITKKFIDRNFLGKGYVSGAYITPVGAKLVNFATFLAGKIVGKKGTQLLAKGNFAQKAVSSFLATSYFLWLRTLSPEQAGGGGKEGLSDDAEGFKSDAPSGNDIETVRKAGQLFEVEVEEREPPSEEEIEKTQEELRKIPAANELQKQFLEEYDEALELLKKQKFKEAKRKAAQAAKKAEDKVRKKYNKVVRESPKKKDIPAKARGEAEKNTNAANDSIGAAGVGDGAKGGVGIGIGKGVGVGTAEQVLTRGNIINYVNQRLGRSGDDGTYASTTNADLVKPHPQGSQMPRDVGDLLIRAVRKYRRKYKSTASPYEVIQFSFDAGDKDFKLSNKGIQSAKDYKDFKRYLMRLAVDLEKAEKLFESVEKYREKVLNERLQKLTIGLTK